MPITGTSGAINNCSLYVANSSLKSKGDTTNTADGLTQKANSGIHSLNNIQRSKYPQISVDNPINVILSIEGVVTGEGNTAKAYAVINDIIKAAKEKITDDMDPDTKLATIYRIIHQDLHIKYGEQDLLSEGLANENKCADCITGSFIYLAVAHEMGLPVYLATTKENKGNDHAFIFYKTKEGKYYGFDTTSISGIREKDQNQLNHEAETIVKNGKNMFMLLSTKIAEMYTVHNGNMVGRSKIILPQ